MKKLFLLSISILISLAAFAQGQYISARQLRLYPIITAGDTAATVANDGRMWYDFTTDEYRGIRNGTRFSFANAASISGAFWKTAGLTNLTASTAVDANGFQFELFDANGINLYSTGLLADLKLQSAKDMTMSVDGDIDISAPLGNINMATLSGTFLSGTNSGLHINNTAYTIGYKHALWNPSPTTGNGIAVGFGDIDGTGDGSYAAILVGAADREVTMAAASVDGQSVELFFQANNGPTFDTFFEDNRTSPKGLMYGATGYVTQLHSLADKEYVDTKIGGTIAATQIGFGSALNTLASDADLTFTGGNTLNTTNAVISTALTNSALTSTRIPVIGTAGLFADDADLTFTGGNTLNTPNLVSGIVSSTTGLTVRADAGSLILRAQGLNSVATFTNGLNRLEIVDNGAFFVNSSAGTSGQVLTSTGNTSPPAWQNAVVTLPAGSDTQIQFNNSGAFGADADLSFTGGNRLNATNATVTTDLTLSSATSGRMAFHTTGGRFTDDVDLTYESTNNTLTIGTCCVTQYSEYSDSFFRVSKPNGTDGTGMEGSATGGSIITNGTLVLQGGFEIGSVVADEPSYLIFQGEVATTNATTTSIFTYNIPSGNVVNFDIDIVARRTGGAAGTAEDGAAYNFRGVYHLIAGLANAIGSPTITTIGESQAAWGISTTLSGADVIFQVTGAVDNNITWQLSKGVAEKVGN